MSRSSLFIAASVHVLAACQPAAEAPEEIVAETPPVVAEETVAETATEVAETVEAEVEAAVAEVVAEEMSEAEDADHDHDHEGEEHDHGDEHDHEGEAHDHAEDAHDHDENHDHDAHDHGDDDDHDHAGGEAHVHGLSDLAASLDGNTLSVNVEGAMANFDLDETLRTLDDTTPFSTGTVEVIGGDCTMSGSDVSIRPINDHGNLVIDLTYTCGAPDGLEAINVTGFQTFAGFEQVNAVYLTDTGQVAETLTESDTRLDLN